MAFGEKTGELGRNREVEEGKTSPTINRGCGVRQVELLQGIGLGKPIGQRGNSLRTQVVVREIQFFCGKGIFRDAGKGRIKGDAETNE